MKKSILISLLASLLASAPAANAATMRLDATSLLPDVGDFFVLFDDGGDEVLQFAEVTEFSGVRFLGDFYPVLRVVGDSGGLSTPSSVVTGCGVFGGVAGWCFGESIGTGQLSGPGSVWSFASRRVSVPEPGAFAVLVVGLVGVGMARRRCAR